MLCRTFASRFFSKTIMMTSPSLTLSVLEAQDDTTSTALIELLKEDPKFISLSASEGNDLMQRDALDEEKLARGIAIACDRGVLPPNPPVEPVTKIDVFGKTAEEVCQEIVALLPKGGGGLLLVLQGLSGTGKGTTVKKLQGVLPNCMTWSNGNVFRALTYLALQRSPTLGPNTLTAELLADCMSKLSFQKFDDGYDVVMEDQRVSRISNTLLKAPNVSQNVPIVAEVSQGEVVLFASRALQILESAGCSVLLEGRAQTLNYIRTQNRFELIIKSAELLGQRRAAQRVMAAALQEVKKQQGQVAVPEIRKALMEALAGL